MESKAEYTTVPRCNWCRIALPLVCSGKRVNPKRLYCSGRCRQAAYRARQKEAKDVDR